MSADFTLSAPLSPEEVRVLGCLIEKQFLTPDAYPLSLNALLAACNQKTSRDPVVNYDDATVAAALDALQSKGLSARIVGPDHRVPKYGELLSAKANMRTSELALLCVLMLRGPQTPGELKERSSRIYAFGDIEEVEFALERLCSREPQPLVAKLPRQPGFKEARYAHLLAGAVPLAGQSVAMEAPADATRADRLGSLEDEVAQLRQRLERLEQAFADFRRQFD